MAIADDWTINYGTQEISHTSGSTVYTCNEMYSWLMDTFDELGQLDDDVPMSAQTPTAYSLINGWAFSADSDYEYLSGGAINDTTNDDLWANIYTLGTIVAGSQIYIEQDGAEITPWWSTDHIDVLIKVKASGVEIDSGVITVYIRDLGSAFDFFEIDLTAGGRNAVPLATATDANNQTAEGTIATWTDVTITFGSISRDLNNGNGSQPYDVEIDCGGRTLEQVYERLKWACRHNASGSLNGNPAEFYQSADEVTPYTPIKVAPFGTFAGGTFFGARGVWLTNYAANQTFQLTDADGDTQNPPNLVYVDVTSLVSGDSVMVAVLDAPAGDIEKDTYTGAASGNGSGDPDFVVQESIAGDTPSAGWFRVDNGDGTEDRYAYSSWTGSTFTLDATEHPGGLGRTYNSAEDVWVPLLDLVADSTSESNSLIYSADIPVRIRVRKKGIIPFEIDGTVSSTGLSQAAIRTTDTIVS
jgi:hypothetical protein